MLNSGGLRFCNSIVILLNAMALADKPIAHDWIMRNYLFRI